MVVALGAGCGDDGPAAEPTDGEPAPTTGETDEDTTAGSGPTTAATDPTADDGSGDDDPGPASRPNWHEDIAPLVAEHCANCHDDGGIAPYPLQTYAQAEALSIVMALQAEARLMPPWHAVETDECEPQQPFAHDARLSDEEIQLLRDWADAGAPEGDPALAAPLPPTPDFDLPQPTTTISMGGEITIEPQGNKRDFFHCLSFDPGNAEDVYIDGMQVVPGNSAIAHHVLIYVDLSASSAGWTNGISEDCGGGAGVSNVLLVGAWVPGGLPILAPEGVGIRLPAGARLVFNVHYHATTTTEVDDTTALALRWTESAPEYVTEFMLVGAPGNGQLVDPPFRIPAGATGHEEMVEFTVPNVGPADVRLWTVGNHMHRVGVDMKTSVVHADGTEECLVQTPAWDFDWQRFYAYDVPIEQSPQVQGGDTVRVRCRYDNTLDNPSVQEMLTEEGLTEPQEVSQGQRTLDEMCVAGVGVAVRLP